MSKKQKQFAELQNSLNITDTTLFKAPNKKSRKYNIVKDNIPQVEDYNFQADLLFLPTTKEGYRYLLTMVDLATDEIDFEPIKDKEPNTILNSMKIIFKRPYLNEPYASLRTDSGTEFKGVFHKYLINKAVLHKISLTNRHRQTANIENVNKILGKLLNGYMNSIQIKTKKPYVQWTDILEILRVKLNKIRKITIPKKQKYKEFELSDKKPKFKTGDMVYRILDYPKKALNEKLNGVFREGDLRYDPIPKKIKQILYFTGDVPNRYLLEGINETSYSEWELLKCNNVTDEVVEIKAILDINYNRKEKKYYYKLWMHNERKANAGYYERSLLVKDIGLTAVEELDNIYKDLKKEKAKKKK